MQDPVAAIAPKNPVGNRSLYQAIDSTSVARVAVKRALRAFGALRKSSASKDTPQAISGPIEENKAGMSCIVSVYRHQENIVTIAIAGVPTCTPLELLLLNKWIV